MYTKDNDYGGCDKTLGHLIFGTTFSAYSQILRVLTFYNKKGVTMKDMINKVLENKSLTVFLAIFVAALLLGWIGG